MLKESPSGNGSSTADQQTLPPPLKPTALSSTHLFKCSWKTERNTLDKLKEL